MKCFANLVIYTALEVCSIRRAYSPIGRFVPAEGLHIHTVREGDGKRVQAIGPKYGEIDVPVMILAGSSNQLVDVEGNVRALGETLPNGELVLVEGTGHKLDAAHPEVVMEVSARQGLIHHMLVEE